MNQPISRGAVAFAASIVIVASQAGADTTFGVADDFSVVSNPAGVWSYGYSNGVGGPLVLFVDHGTGGTIDWWNYNISLGAPGIAYNRSPNVVSSGTVQFAPWQAIFHPGPSGQACVYRFTASVAGNYTVSAAFSGADTWGTTTNVHILVDGEQIFSGVVSGFGPGTGPSYLADLQLGLGATIDFAVSTSNSFYNDSTGIDATLTLRVPPCGADLDADGVVGAADLGILLGAWGTGGPAADLDGDGVVGATDLGLLLGAWGAC